MEKAHGEAVMEKALEGGSESGKEEALFPGPIPIPARWKSHEKQ